MHESATQTLRELDTLTLRGWPLPAADDGADKEDRGQVLVVAGSREIPGAAMLAATAALRAGAGKLTIATAHSVAPGLALAMPEARVIALPESAQGGLAAAGAALLHAVAGDCSAALIGPGLLDGPGSADFVLALLAQLKNTPVILDALAMDAALHAQRFEQPLLLTPHAGEMAHLSGRSKDEVQADPLALAQAMARKRNAVVALKGALTFIVSPEGAAWRHVSATPGLGTSGSGDVLAGIMAGLAARGAPLVQAAAWGVVLHALAGRRLARRHGRLGFLARELPAQIPSVMHGIGAAPGLTGAAATGCPR
ncbi:MAG: NAD(P)H-hydrate dehydratase [Pseudomonadota bacterium]|nr:NAD(P)H-hydrate dehydratase [Pseudomonadota bacterium]